MSDDEPDVQWAIADHPDVQRILSLATQSDLPKVDLQQVIESHVDPLSLVYIATARATARLGPDPSQQDVLLLSAVYVEAFITGCQFADLDPRGDPPRERSMPEFPRGDFDPLVGYEDFPYSGPGPS